MLYKMRKEKIERVFADAKEKHAMRYTPYRGLTQVTNWVKLKFACLNLKNWHYGNQRIVIIPTNIQYLHIFSSQFGKITIRSNKTPFKPSQEWGLSTV